MPKQVIEQEKNWYVIHTYSGYEDAVAKNLKQRIESLGMEDKIFNVIVPKEQKIKIITKYRLVSVCMHWGVKRVFFKQNKSDLFLIILIIFILFI